MKSQITLSTTKQLKIEPYPIRDYAIAQGLIPSRKLFTFNNGTRKSGCVLTRNVLDSTDVRVRGYSGHSVAALASNRVFSGIMPRIEGEILFDKHNKPYINYQGHRVSINEFGQGTINGEAIFWPDFKLRDAQKLERANLSFTTDNTPLNFINTPYEPKPNPTFKMQSYAYKGLATEIETAKRLDDSATYNNGDAVKSYAIEHFALTPIRAEWNYNAIQFTEVITSIQLDTMRNYQQRHTGRENKLPTEHMQVGRVMRDHLFPEMVKSAQFYAELRKNDEANKQNKKRHISLGHKADELTI